MFLVACIAKEGDEFSANEAADYFRVPSNNGATAIWPCTISTYATPGLDILSTLNPTQLIFSRSSIGSRLVDIACFRTATERLALGSGSGRRRPV